MVDASVDMSMDAKSQETFFKFILIGDAGVGKTSILLRYTKDEFANEYHVTVGAEFGSKVMNLGGGNNVRLQIWDTAGQESFLSVIKSFYRDAHAVFVVYDVTRKDSFENLNLWMQDILENADPSAILVLIGNQVDREDKREVSYEEGEQFMKEKNIHYFFETSAYNGANVDFAFSETARLAFANLLRERMDQSGASFYEKRKDTVTLRPTRVKKSKDSECAC